MTPTRDQFATWLFESDKEHGLWLSSQTWYALPLDERELYYEEADYYINEHPRDDWPVCVLER